MATKLTDFLVSFGDNPQQIQDFEQDPQAVMTRAGLTPGEQNMILNRDMQAIRTHLHADPGLKQALGVSSTQTLPSKLPMLVFIVHKPKP